MSASRSGAAAGASTAATAAALTATLGVADASWVFAVRQASGMAPYAELISDAHASSVRLEQERISFSAVEKAIAGR